MHALCSHQWHARGKRAPPTWSVDTAARAVPNPMLPQHVPGTAKSTRRQSLRVCSATMSSRWGSLRTSQSTWACRESPTVSWPASETSTRYGLSGGPVQYSYACVSLPMPSFVLGLLAKRLCLNAAHAALIGGEPTCVHAHLQMCTPPCRHSSGRLASRMGWRRPSSCMSRTLWMSAWSACLRSTACSSR